MDSIVSARRRHTLGSPRWFSFRIPTEYPWPNLDRPSVPRPPLGTITNRVHRPSTKKQPAEAASLPMPKLETHSPRVNSNIDHQHFYPTTDHNQHTTVYAEPLQVRRSLIMRSWAIFSSPSLRVNPLRILTRTVRLKIWKRSSTARLHLLPNNFRCSRPVRITRRLVSIRNPMSIWHYSPLISITIPRIHRLARPRYLRLLVRHLLIRSCSRRTTSLITNPIETCTTPMIRSSFIFILKQTRICWST